MTDPLDGRDVSAMFSESQCVICGAPQFGAPGHLLQHLELCDAVVVNDAIVPTASVPWPAKDGPAPGEPVLLGARRPDAKLIALARAAQKRSQR